MHTNLGTGKSALSSDTSYLTIICPGGTNDAYKKAIGEMSQGKPDETGSPCRNMIYSGMLTLNSHSHVVRSSATCPSDPPCRGLAILTWRLYVGKVIKLLQICQL